MRHAKYLALGLAQCKQSVLVFGTSLIKVSGTQITTRKVSELE